MGKGSSGSTVQQTQGPPAYAQPYHEQALSFADQAASQPYQPYMGPRVAGFTPGQEQALNAQFNRGMMGSPTTNAATGLGTATMGGAFLGNQTNAPLQNYAYGTIAGDRLNPATNPGLGAWADYNTRNIMANYGAQLGRNFGNTGVAEVVGDAVSRANAPLYGMERQLQQQAQQAEQQRMTGLYGMERGMMGNAMNMAPSIAQAGYGDIGNALSAETARQGLNQQLLDVPYQEWQTAQQWPGYQLGLLNQGLSGGSMGGVTTMPNPNQANPLASGLGAGIGGYAMASAIPALASFATPIGWAAGLAGLLGSR